jgi:hypothetical protein
MRDDGMAGTCESLERPRYGGEDNIKMDLKGRAWEYVECIEQAQNRDQ